MLLICPFSCSFFKIKVIKGYSCFISSRSSSLELSSITIHSFTKCKSLQHSINEFTVLLNKSILLQVVVVTVIFFELSFLFLFNK